MQQEEQPRSASGEPKESNQEFDALMNELIEKSNETLKDCGLDEWNPHEKLNKNIVQLGNLSHEASQQLRNEIKGLSFHPNVYGFTNYKLADFVLASAWSVAVGRLSLAIQPPEDVKAKFITELINEPIIPQLRELILRTHERIQAHIVKHFAELIAKS